MKIKFLMRKDFMGCHNCAYFLTTRNICDTCTNDSNFMLDPGYTKETDSHKLEKLYNDYNPFTIGIDKFIKSSYYDKSPTPRLNHNDSVSGILAESKGTKYDNDKVDWTLIPWRELEQVVEVLEFGAKKYSRDNWKHIEPSRYEKAAMRHLISYVTGEKTDPESTKAHLAHLMCNILFLMWNDNEKNNTLK